jgi:hypothetical protein
LYGQEYIARGRWLKVNAEQLPSDGPGSRIKRATRCEDLEGHGIKVRIQDISDKDIAGFGIADILKVDGIDE